MESTTSGSRVAVSNNSSNGSAQQNGYLKLSLPVQFHNGKAKTCVHCKSEMPNLDSAVRPKEAKTVCVACNRIKGISSRVSLTPANSNNANSWAKRIA